MKEVKKTYFLGNHREMRSGVRNLDPGMEGMKKTS